jgi:hypothetical protein
MFSTIHVESNSFRLGKKSFRTIYPQFAPVNLIMQCSVQLLYFKKEIHRCFHNHVFYKKRLNSLILWKIYFIVFLRIFTPFRWNKSLNMFWIWCQTFKFFSLNNLERDTAFYAVASNRHIFSSPK